MDTLEVSGWPAVRYSIHPNPKLGKSEKAVMPSIKYRRNVAVLCFCWYTVFVDSHNNKTAMPHRLGTPLPAPQGYHPALQGYTLNLPADPDIGPELTFQQIGARWPDIPFRSVLAELPDGSRFYLPGESLSWQAARRIALPLISLTAHLTEQIIPLIQLDPKALLEFARGLSWPAAQKLAKQALWRTSVELIGAPDWLHARLSLAGAGEYATQ